MIILILQMKRRGTVKLSNLSKSGRTGIQTRPF